MTQVIILPAYDLDVLYSKRKIFFPLNEYVDFNTILEKSLCMDDDGIFNFSKDIIWDLINSERSEICFWSIWNNNNHPYKFLSEIEEDCFIDEHLDILLDMFFKEVFNYFNANINFNDVIDRMKKVKVSNSCIFIQIE